MASLAALDRRLHGIFVDTLWAAATASSSRFQYSRRAPAHGAMAPSSMERSSLGTISSGSTSRRMPSPPQVWHAPYGELKEKFRGASSSKEMLSNVQASFSLKATTSSLPS